MSNYQMHVFGIEYSSSELLLICVGLSELILVIGLILDQLESSSLEVARRHLVVLFRKLDICTPDCHKTFVRYHNKGAVLTGITLSISYIWVLYFHSK